MYFSSQRNNNATLLYAHCPSHLAICLLPHRFMIDIHCHILPADDDGPDDLREMLEMLSLAARDGITHIVATPHYRQGESPTTQDIEEKIMQVRKEMVKSS